MLPLPWTGALAAGALLAGAVGGYRYADAQCEAAQAKALRKAHRAFEAQLAKQETEAATFEQERQDAQTVNTARDGDLRTIYRTVTVASDCAAPDAVRSVLQRGVDHANSRATGEPSGAVPADP